MPVPLAAVAIPAAIGLAGLIGDWVSKWQKNKRQRKNNGGVSPVVFGDEDFKLIQQLPPDQQKLATIYAQQLMKNPDEFFSKFPSLDTQGIESVINQDMPTAQELGFQPHQDFYSQLFQDTEFGPIENLARQKFQQETIPTIAERFAGAGGLNSSALKGELGKAATHLESQLAALRSEHGLQRAGTMGDIGLRQQGLRDAQTEAVNRLGQGLRGQQFEQQKGLAELGLAQREQELKRRGQIMDFAPRLMGASSYGTLGLQGRDSGFNQLGQTGLAVAGKALPYYLKGL